MAVSIKAADALIDLLVENRYPNKRAQMLRYMRQRMGRLRYNIDQFLKTYYEKDKL